MSDAKPPFHFIATCSKISLQSYELARLDAAARLRRQLQEVTDEWIEAEVEARLARWALDHRRRNPQIQFDRFVAIDGLGSELKSLPSQRHRIRRRRALPAASSNVPSSLAPSSTAPSLSADDPPSLAGLLPASAAAAAAQRVAPPSTHRVLNRAAARRSSFFRSRRLLRRRTSRF